MYLGDLIVMLIQYIGLLVAVVSIVCEFKFINNYRMDRFNYHVPLLVAFILGLSVFLFGGSV